MLLDAETQARVLHLYYSEHLGYRPIARQLGIDRKTVRAIIWRRKVKMSTEINERPSQLDQHLDFIKGVFKNDASLPATVILQHLRKRGYGGSHSSVQKYVKNLRPVLRPREAFLRLEFLAGECAQVDWAEFGDVFSDGVKIHAFVMVLCYSRKMYVEFTRAEKFEDFIRCHENGFKYFGGVPKECWYDNLATAVTERLGKIVRFNSKFMAFCGHHGFMPYACNPASGNEKGRVESGIKYIRLNFWPGRSFKDFYDLRTQGFEWINTVANKRKHRSTQQIVDLLFENEEKSRLLCLNPDPYNTDEVKSFLVQPDFHVVYDTNRYSVPWTLVAMTITAKINDEELKIFYNEKFVTKHERSYHKNKIFTKPEHENGLLKKKPGASHHNWQLSVIRDIGPMMEEYLKLLSSSSRSLRREIKHLIALCTIYGKDNVYTATQMLLKSGLIGSNNIELALKNMTSETKPKPLTFQKEKLNRIPHSIDLRRYDEYLFNDTPPETEKGANPK